MSLANDNGYHYYEETMLICICNRVNDKQLKSAIAGGAQSVSQVYRQCGCQPQCGKCVDFVREQLLGCKPAAS
jgi:bacterioferritin-associated ferredoxin